MKGHTFHMVPRDYYEAQPIEQNYQPEPMVLGQEDFIHCTNHPEDVVAVGARYYLSDPRPFYLLIIDLEKVAVPVRYDAPGERYPHIYGPLNRDAIIEQRHLERTPDGHFLAPNPA
ncbi:MAG: DUF952 domain-containing protein [Chloroflexi bacterium]|nr:DUF952 domain-containing protein [Chloroflexota bacterium]